LSLGLGFHTESMPKVCCINVGIHRGLAAGFA
jgi:hypothetical protein